MIAIQNGVEGTVYQTEMLRDNTAVKMDLTLKHVGDMEVIQQVVHTAAMQLRDLKLTLLKHAAGEAVHHAVSRAQNNMHALRLKPIRNRRIVPLSDGTEVYESY